mgnify:CR=1 FL=1
MSIGRRTQSIRQGDVVFISTSDVIPEDATEVPWDYDQVAVFPGEDSAEGGTDAVTLFELVDKGSTTRFLKVAEQALLKHDDGSELAVPAGTYHVFRDTESK